MRLGEPSAGLGYTRQGPHPALGMWWAPRLTPGVSSEGRGARSPVPEAHASRLWGKLLSQGYRLGRFSPPDADALFLHDRCA